MPTYAVNALVIRRRDFGENDRIITLFSLERGKQAAIVRGVRRPGAKMAGATEGLILGHVFLAKGKTFDVVTQVQPQRAYLGLRRNLERLTFALYWCELVDRLVPDGEPNEDLFRLTEFVLGELEASGTPETSLRWAEFQLVCLLGYKPIVAVCASCGQRLRGTWVGFSPSVGGLVCSGCLARTGDSVRLPAAAIEVVRLFVMSAEPPTAATNLEWCAKVTRAIWRYHLERDLKSAAFLDEVRRF